MGRLDGRAAIVTGAAQGLGAVYARALSAEGADVAIADVTDGRALAEEIASSRAGARAIARITDVSDEDSVEELVAKTVEAFGRVDILVNNAAIFASMTPGPFEEITPADWDALMAVNVKGPWLCARAAVPRMRAQKYGKIINIASGTLFKGVPYMLHYVSSKGAIFAMTRALSREVGGDGICVNTIAPGLTMSEGVLAKEEHLAYRDQVVASRSIQRDETPEDLIGALIFLSSGESDFMTGQCMVVDGGSITY
jgi:NAD(P)-dependent dehydrogenase (short-subunit alcohol dehydrogenase family)